MAPSRGDSTSHSVMSHAMDASNGEDTAQRRRDIDQKREERRRQQQALTESGAHDTNFTVRGVIAGLLIGLIICFSNVYFGLQTGWISGMAMPSALIGFAFFKSMARCLPRPFTPVENVLVQTVAGAVGTMPLCAGLVGVMPALNYLLKPEEGGVIDLTTTRLIIWSVGICFFGVFIAVPLRREFIIRENLRFPSGTATALMIRVLHGDEGGAGDKLASKATPTIRSQHSEDYQVPSNEGPSQTATNSIEGDENDRQQDWKRKIHLLILAFGISSLYTLASYFIPQLHGLPIFGLPLAEQWVWSFNPSPAYVGQGIIMGPSTSFHMLFGAVLGWGILSPIAKNNGWASGPVSDWETGSKGWIVWISLAIMLVDSIVSIGWLALRPVYLYGGTWTQNILHSVKQSKIPHLLQPSSGGYAPLNSREAAPYDGLDASNESDIDLDDLPEVDAPSEQLPSKRVAYWGLLASCIVCAAAVHLAFPSVMPVWVTVLAILFSLVLSLMGVKALGETDLNPVSGISKLAQLVFAAILPKNPSTVTINILAGAISESAALQAGDLLQDMKAGHLIGASPIAQFYGQLIGSAVGSVVAALVYKLYTSVYTIPSGLFQVPTAYVWIFTARLVTGAGLPPNAANYALGAGMIWAVLTALRIYLRGSRVQPWIPGGVAVAVGMYNVPSFTLARALGGAISAWWMKRRRGDEAQVVVLASGLILGEGVVSIVNLVLASFEVPHL